jgi:hypothetical protein
MAPLIDNVMNFFNSGSAKLTSHTDPSKRTGALPALSIGIYNSSKVDDLSGLNESAVEYYNQLINTGAYDTDSQDFKTFMDLLNILSTTQVRNKMFDKNRSDLATNLKFFIEKYRSGNEGDSMQERLDICKGLNKLNQSLKANPISRGYNFKLIDNYSGEQVPTDYCNKIDNNAYITVNDVDRNIKDITDGLFRSSAANLNTSVLTKKKYHGFVQHKDADGNHIEMIDGPDEPIPEAPNQIGGRKFKEFKGGSSLYYKNALDKLAIAKESGDTFLIKNVINDIENHPIYSPKFEELTTNDRLIMIFVTFIIRSIALFLIQWGIDSSYITSFKQGLTYYIYLYSLLFLLVVCAVNNSYNDNISLKLLIYYINIEAQGYFRIIVHLLLLFLLFPIIFILKNTTKYNENDFPMLSYQDKIKVKEAINLFTLAIWIVTSAVVIRF